MVQKQCLTNRCDIASSQTMHSVDDSSWAISTFFLERHLSITQACQVPLFWTWRNSQDSLPLQTCPNFWALRIFLNKAESVLGQTQRAGDQVFPASISLPFPREYIHACLFCFSGLTSLAKSLCYGSQGMRFGFSWLPYWHLVLASSSSQRLGWSLRNLRMQEQRIISPKWPFVEAQTEICHPHRCLWVEERWKHMSLGKKLEDFWSEADENADPQTTPSEHLQSKCLLLINQPIHTYKRPGVPGDNCTEMKPVDYPIVHVITFKKPILMRQFFRVEP